MWPAVWPGLGAWGLGPEWGRGMEVLGSILEGSQGQSTAWSIQDSPASHQGLTAVCSLAHSPATALLRSELRLRPKCPRWWSANGTRRRREALTRGASTATGPT